MFGRSEGVGWRGLVQSADGPPVLSLPACSTGNISLWYITLETFMLFISGVTHTHTFFSAKANCLSFAWSSLPPVSGYNHTDPTSNFLVCGQRVRRGRRRGLELESENSKQVSISHAFICSGELPHCCHVRTGGPAASPSMINDCVSVLCVNHPNIRYQVPNAGCNYR